MVPTNRDNYWIPLSDLMTVLMVIFLFISVSYMIEIKSEQEKDNQIIEDYKKTKTDLLKDLQNSFVNELKKDSWLQLDTNNLTFRFTNSGALFDRGQSVLKKDFQKTLSDFFPKYLSIILKPEYRKSIEEIRIEGHTDTVQGYMYNIQLSQERTNSVLDFMRNLPYYQQLPKDDQKRLTFWITANGFSYGRTLDRDGNYTYISQKPTDDSLCRRVEFRIVTTSYNLVEDFIKQLNK